MKIKKYLVALLMIFSMFWAMGAFAQEVQWKDWNWEVYNIKFKIPTFLKPTTYKDTKKFSATDHKSFSMNIIPWNVNITDPQVGAKRIYDDFKVVQDKEIVNQYAVNIPNFQGYMILGKGLHIQHQKVQFFVIFILYEPKSKLNLLVSFGWWDEADKNEFYSDICDKVAESVKLIEQ